MTPLIIAHRGLHESYPENSLEAICAATREDFSGAEFDIRQTCDGVFIVHHDTRLKSGRPIHSLLFGELEEELDGSVVLLSDVLQKSPPSLHLYIEIKDRFADVNNLERILKEHDAIVRSTILSFHPDVLRIVSKQLPRWLLIAFNLRYYANYVGHSLRPIALAKKLGVEAIGFHHPLARSWLVKKAHHAGLKVIPWTVDNPFSAEKFQELGVNGIISNNPIEILEHFKSLTIQKSQKVV